MPALPSAGQWKRWCLSRDAREVGQGLEKLGWERVDAPRVLSASVQERVTRLWAAGCEHACPQALCQLAEHGLLPGSSPGLSRGVDKLLALMGSDKLSEHKNWSSQCWSSVAPHLREFTDAQAWALSGLPAHRQDVVLVLDSGAWLPSEGEALLRVMGRFRANSAPMEVVMELLAATLDRFPEVCATAPHTMVGWVEWMVDLFMDVQTKDVDVRRFYMVLMDRLLGEVVSAQGVEALHQMGDRASLLRRSVDRGRQVFAHELELATLLGRHGCDPFLPEGDGQDFPFFQMVLKRRAAEGDPRLEEDPWKRWVVDERAGVLLEGLLGDARLPEVSRTWKAWRLDHALSEGLVVERPRARL